MSLLASALMPARAADGTGAFLLCTGDGPVSMALDPVTGRLARVPDEDPIGTSRDRCAWACAQAVAMVPAPVAMPTLAVAAARAAPPPPALLLTEARTTGLPPATGPPACL